MNRCGRCLNLMRNHQRNADSLPRTGPWFMMASPEFEMPDGKQRFGAYEYPNAKGGGAASPTTPAMAHHLTRARALLVPPCLAISTMSRQQAASCVERQGPAASEGRLAVHFAQLWATTCGRLRSTSTCGGMCRTRTRLTRLERRNASDTGACHLLAADASPACRHHRACVLHGSDGQAGRLPAMRHTAQQLLPILDSCTTPADDVSVIVSWQCYRVACDLQEHEWRRRQGARHIRYRLRGDGKRQLQLPLPAGIIQGELVILFGTHRLECTILKADSDTIQLSAVLCRT